MTETSLEEVILEKDFVVLLKREAEPFFRLVNSLLAMPEGRWGKRHYHHLVQEAEELETFLDDHGAADNRTFHMFRELVASVRWVSATGFSVSHLIARMPGYGVDDSFGPQLLINGRTDMLAVRAFLNETTRDLVDALYEEAAGIDVPVPSEPLPEDTFAAPPARRRLPQNVGEEELVDEEQKIAEVASKFLAASDMIERAHVHRIEDPLERRRFLEACCSEEQARVYQATVHNLQSTYDTYIKQTVLEAKDARLAKLRGFSSVALHLLEGVTHLMHFIERHESGTRSAEAQHGIGRIIERARVEDVVLNQLLYWAAQSMIHGRTIAEDLLPAYTNVQELEVELPDNLKLHARPASLIVRIVGRYGTPVELSVEGETCSAGSILELLVTVGSHPDARLFSFRGDENPLRDIALLFQYGLGEEGLATLPPQLSYLSES